MPQPLPKYANKLSLKCGQEQLYGEFEKLPGFYGLDSLQTGCGHRAQFPCYFAMFQWNWDSPKSWTWLFVLQTFYFIRYPKFRHFWRGISSCFWFGFGIESTDFRRTPSDRTHRKLSKYTLAVLSRIRYSKTRLKIASFSRFFPVFQFCFELSQLILGTPKRFESWVSGALRFSAELATKKQDWKLLPENWN